MTLWPSVTARPYNHSGQGRRPGRRRCGRSPTLARLRGSCLDMELRQIRKSSLVEKLVAEVRGQISAGQLAEGQQLPTEARMAAEFGVSRPLLREALAELRAEGFVETVNGRGTFVRHPSESDLADAPVRQLQLSGREPELTVDHLYEARRAIEGSAAGLAAQRVTP